MQKSNLALTKYLKYCVVLMVFVFTNKHKVIAQKTAIYEDETRIYQRAIELFDKEKYAAAQKHFDMFAGKSKDQVYVVNAKYYAATCAMELSNNDALKLFQGIIKTYPQYDKAELAKFQLGRHFYRNKDYKKAVKWLSDFDDGYLSESQLLEYYFIKGFCNFKTDNFDESQKAFKNIKDQKTKYYEAVNYYYGYVSYRQANYNEALEHFARVKNHKIFGPLSNVYVAQIYFAKKDYAQVIKYCDTITNNDVAIDVAGMLGQSHYIQGNYEKALPYLVKYMNEAPAVPSRNDFYRLAYAFKVNKQYEKAVDNFLKIQEEKDTLSQYTFFQLAESYLAMDKKPNAKTAFTKCIGLGFIAKLNEESLFNMAKLNYEVGSNSSALTSLTSFIETYPKSAYISEAKSLVSNLLLTTKNYKEAIRILESIADKDEKDLTILQKIYYYRAEELYLQNDYKTASEFFNKVLAAGNYNKLMLALSHFWLAEIAYKDGGFANATIQFKKAQQIDELKATRFYNTSFYSLGYTYLKTEDYKNAIEGFKKYAELDTKMNNPEVYTDAVTRTADCYFAQGNYEKSIDYYNLVINKDLNGSDYALYQKAMILGVVKKPNEKIYALSTLIERYPKSIFIDDALFERADEQLKNNNLPEAIKGFDNIINNYPRSAFIRKAYLNKGLTLFNMSKDDDALKTMKTLATTYANTDEARQGLVVLKQILVSKGESDVYFDFIKAIPNFVESASSQDSLTYQSAFNNYKSGLDNYSKKDFTASNTDFAKASKGFGNYLNRFAGGYFTAKAYYYKAESDNVLKAYDDALVGYEYTANAIRSDFTERSTRQTAVIYFLRKNYDKAFEYYAALERIAGNKDNLQLSLLGQLRASMIMGKMDTATQVSFRYVNSGIATKEGLSDAKINIARFYMLRNKPDSAWADFNYLLKENKEKPIGAEANYNIALIQFLRKDYKASSKTIFELNDNFSKYEFWVAKAFILLSDVYVAQKDYFQAKATLQSIIDEYSKDDLKIIALEKLKKIEEDEAKGKLEQKKKVDERIKSRD
jgi:tetratricopeptide (TPR) repeat protein